MNLKFTLKNLALSLVVLLFSGSAFSQDPVSFYVGKINNICHDTVSVPVYVTKFRSMEDFQFSVNWDTTVFTIVSGAGGYTIPAAVSGIGFNAGSVNSQRRGFGVAFFDPTLVGQSLPDSSVLFTLHFTLKNGYSSSNPAFVDSFYFGNTPTAVTPADTVDAGGNPGGVPTNYISGYVSSAVVPAISVLGSVYTAVTAGATQAPSGYQWYTVTYVGPGGPGSIPTLTPISGATAATYNYGFANLEYLVVATYANGCKDTSFSVLPVKLLNFKGKTAEKTNVLSWTTANEINSASFEIERSNNGEAFAQIGSVKAAGNSSIEKTYSFNDVNLNAAFSFYYRLKMVDANGSFVYSNIIKLNKQGKSVFQVQPNPVENSTIKVYGSNMKYAKVYDINGKQLLSQELSNSDHAELKMSNLVKGVYIINVTTTDGLTQSEKFIVK